MIDMDSPTCTTKRTLIDIAWTCILTTIICAWVSVHPNVPPPHHWRGVRRRIKLMFWTIITPELILAWAVRQWFAAREIRDTVNGMKRGPHDKGFLTEIIQTIRRWFNWKPNELHAGSDSGTQGWTMAHGHLLAMGGITLVDPSFEERTTNNDPKGKVLTLEDYKQLITTTTTTFKLPRITEADVADKSKGDFFSKLIAILQTSWFILQCIARRQQGLALTELELVTVALASFNAITYAFWWKKPLQAQEPIRIYFRPPEVMTPRSAILESGEQTLDGTSQDEQFIPEVSAHAVISTVWKEVQDFVKFITSDLLSNPCENGPIFTFGAIFILIPFFIFIIVSYLIFLPFPLGIIFLLKILKTTPATDNELTTESRPNSISDASTTGPHKLRVASRIIHFLNRLRCQLVSLIGRVSQKWLKKFLGDESIAGFFTRWFFCLPALFLLLLATTLFLFPFFTLLHLISFIFTAVFGIVTTSTINCGATHVPSFYAPSTKSDRYSRMVVFALFGVIFGGLHCLGWNFAYPTPYDEHVWRSTSLAITFIPVIVAPIDYVLENFDSLNDFGRLVLDLTMTFLLFVYVPARLSLIVQAAALLRHQPPTAFQIVDWTRYLPHVL